MTRGPGRGGLRCATWNVHRAVGPDGRFAPDRVIDAIAAEIVPFAPRVLALQEADADDPPHGGLLDMGRLARETGLRSVHDGRDMRWSERDGGFLGNVLMLDPAMAVRRRLVVALPGLAPRAAVLAEVVRDGAPLRVVSCHLSLSQALRAAQLRTVGRVVARAEPMPTVLLGDLNEWRPWGGLALSRRITGMALSGPARRTFPSGRPVLALDRILADGGVPVRDVRALDGPLVRSASDHRPLVGLVGP